MKKKDSSSLTKKITESKIKKANSVVNLKPELDTKPKKSILLSNKTIIKFTEDIEKQEKKIKEAKYWNSQYTYWANKNYEIINFNTLLKQKNNLKNEHYELLLQKILNSSSKNIITLIEILENNKIKINLKEKMEKVIEAINSLPQKIKVLFSYDNFFITKTDVIKVLQENKVQDLINGNIIVTLKSYYNEIIVKKKNSTEEINEERKQEYRKIKLIIAAIGLIIIICLVLLTIFSPQIAIVTNIVGDWFNKIKISPELISVLHFVLNIIIVYIIYRIILLITKASFAINKRSSLKREFNRIGWLKINLKDRLEQYSYASINIEKKTKSALRSVIVFLRIILVIFIFLSLLTLFHINYTSLFASATIITVILTVGAQSTLGDYFAGLLFTFEDHYNVGDLVTINNIHGKIVSANLRRICIETSDKEQHFILHSQIKHVLNYSKSSNKAKVVFDIAYEANPREVIKILKHHFAKNWRKNSNIHEEPEIYAITNFNASGIGFAVYAECEKESFKSVERWIRLEIFDLFKINKIEIPYQKITLVK